MRRLQPGSRLRGIPAADWNDMADVAMAYREGRLTLPRGAANTIHDRDVILLRNESGEDRARFDVLGIDGIVFTPSDNEKDFKNQPCVKGILPTSPEHIGRFAVLLEPIAVDKVGRAQVSGVVPARVNVTDESHLFADIDDGEAILQSLPIGAARILYQESGTGEKWCLLRLGDVQQASVRFELTATLSPGGSAEAKIVRWDGGLSVSDDVIQVHDALNVFKGNSGARGLAEFWLDSQRYEIYQLGCA